MNLGGPASAGPGPGLVVFSDQVDCKTGPVRRPGILSQLQASERHW